MKCSVLTCWSWLQQAGTEAAAVPDHHLLLCPTATLTDQHLQAGMTLALLLHPLYCLHVAVPLLTLAVDMRWVRLAAGQC